MAGAALSQKPEAKNLLQVSHMGTGYQSIHSSSTVFPGLKQGAGWEAELPGLEQAPIWDPGIFKAKTLATLPWHWAQTACFYD